MCVGFNPTANKGVYVGHDGGSAKSSFVGLPGSEPRRFEKGNWMIRATVAQGSTTRTWADTTGKFTVEAELLGVTQDQIRLKRTDGTEISVPLAIERKRPGVLAFPVPGLPRGGPWHRRCRAIR